MEIMVYGFSLVAIAMLMVLLRTGKKPAETSGI
jgi:hypothetical protein